MTECHNFLDMFDSNPRVATKSDGNGFAQSLPDVAIWVDNTSAISTAKSNELMPKSRHYALRYLRVRDHGNKIFFAPTNRQRADGLTKLNCSVEQRDLLIQSCLHANRLESPDSPSSVVLSTDLI